MRGLSSTAAAHDLAREVGRVSDDPHVAPDGTALDVGASTGLAVTDRPTSAESLLAAADAAMYTDKLARRQRTGAGRPSRPGRPRDPRSPSAGGVHAVGR